jgi:hypothetical protein
VGEKWIFSSSSRSFGYGYEAVRIRIKYKMWSMRFPWTHSFPKGKRKIFLLKALCLWVDVVMTLRDRVFVFMLTVKKNMRREIF